MIENIIKIKDLHIYQEFNQHYNNVVPFWLYKLIESGCRETLAI